MQEHVLHDVGTLVAFFAMLLSPCAVAYRVCLQDFDLDYGFVFDFDFA